VKYKGSIVRRGLLAGAIVLAGGSAVSLAATPAGASNTQMTAVGSFTTFFMMHALFPQLNDINPNPETGSGTQSIASDSQTCSGGITYNTTTQAPNGSGAGKTALAAEETAAATQQGCLDFSRSSSPPAPHSETLPSGGAETGDPTGSHFDYYAYALDGVAPLVGSDAPSSVRTAGSDTGTGNGLTLAQVQGIYECTITNWNQLTINGHTGANAPIVAFWPQAGSGTRAVYTDVLGFDPTHPGTAPDTCTTTTQPITSFAAGAVTGVPNEENAEDGIIYQNTVGDPNTTPATPIGTVASAAIYIYSAGKFSQEWNDTADNNSTANNFVKQTLDGSATPDNTVGNFLAGTLTMASMQGTGGTGEAYVDLTAQVGPFNQDSNRGTLAVDGTTVAEANEWYHNLPDGDVGNPSDSTSSIPGIRYVYNVADTVLPGYNGAKMMVGFDNQTSGTKSLLCNGDDATTITAQGFLPMSTGGSAPSGSDAAGATCRQFQGLSYPSQGAVIHWTTPTFDSRNS
jgi:ABC-type phosphate transport system substrate-binding protein